jgi:hypothetical protein
MTYIHPDNHKSILNRVLAGLIFTSLVGVIWLVALYNNVVNVNHTIAAEKAQLDTIGANNTALNNQVTVALGTIQSADLAAQNGLVQDNHPQYFSPSWPIASQR